MFLYQSVQIEVTTLLLNKGILYAHRMIDVLLFVDVVARRRSSVVSMGIFC